MNDTLKKWLLYGGGLLLAWGVDALVLPRLDLWAMPVLLPKLTLAPVPWVTTSTIASVSRNAVVSFST